MEYTDDEITVVVDGKLRYQLNRNLLSQQNISPDKLKELLDLHVERCNVIDIMKEMNDGYFLRGASQMITEIDFDLQKVWGFPIHGIKE